MDIQKTIINLLKEKKSNIKYMNIRKYFGEIEVNDDISLKNILILLSDIGIDVEYDNLFIELNFFNFLKNN